MRFSASVVTASLAGFTVASPFNKRELGGVLMCTGAYATGQCQHKVYDMDICYQLEDPWYMNIKTFAPDGEAFACYPRMTDCGGLCKSPTGCTCGAVNFTYEHKYDFGAISWDTMMKSFDCFVRTEE